MPQYTDSDFRIPPSANRVEALLRHCAMSFGRTSAAVGAFCRRLAARAGNAKAITAAALKLAVLVYRLVSATLTYHEPRTRRLPPLFVRRQLRNAGKKIHRFTILR